MEHGAGPAACRSGYVGPWIMYQHILRFARSDLVPEL
jgi:hypothetical protein